VTRCQDRVCGVRWLSIRGVPDRRDDDGSEARAAGEGTATMAQYLILIYGDEQAHAAAGQELWDQLHQGHNKFGENNATAILGGNALQPTGTATSIRGNTVTDGPFAETKEALGGYYLIEAKDLDEAISVAKQVPAPNGGLEVRPVMVFD
jgi:hypothetical protein